jgi:hypothetical protein
MNPKQPSPTWSAAVTEQAWAGGLVLCTLTSLSLMTVRRKRGIKMLNSSPTYCAQLWTR